MVVSVLFRNGTRPRRLRTVSKGFREAHLENRVAEVEIADLFRRFLERMGHASFHFHFLVSRLRLHLQSNDFSVWFKEELGLERLARQADRIDITMDTIDGAKARLLRLVDRELAA